MNHKLFGLTLAVCIALFAGSGTNVWARVGAPRSHVDFQQPAPPVEDHDFRPTMDDAGIDRFSEARLRPMAAQLKSMAPTDLGEPGTVYHFVRQYGVTEDAYFEDNGHLNQPYGLWASGSHVWIAESYGRRVSKYTSNGSFVSQIGKAGFRYSNETTLDNPTDVGVDSEGNIWVADSWANHVIKFNAAGEWLLELGEMWVWGTDNDHFDGAYSLAFDTVGNVYVSDVYNHRVQVFNSTGGYLATIGQTATPGNANNRFDRPAKIAVDEANRLFVADQNNHRVQVFDVSTPTNPVWLMTLGQTDSPGDANNRLNSPEAVVAVEAINRIYVADGYNNRIQVFNYAGVYLATLNVDTFPYDVAVDGAANLYVARGNTNFSDVRQYTHDLAYVRTYGVTGVPYLTNHLHLNQPGGVAVAPDGSIYIGEMNGQRLLKLNPGGGQIWAVGSPGVRGDANNRFRRITDVDLDSSGRVYAADVGNHRIQIYSPAGVFVATIGQTLNPGSGTNQFNNPNGVAVAPDGRIFVADSGNHRVQVFNASRTRIATIGQTGVSGWDSAHFNNPVDVDVDAAGNIYVVDEQNHRVQVFNSSLSYTRTIGVSGVSGYDFAHLNYPRAVAVDAQGRTFIADDFGARVIVFDASGSFLTVIGSSWGPNSGDTRSTNGLAVDNYDTLYIAEAENHRMTRFAPGAGFFAQRNLYGFGDRWNDRVSALMPFGGQLYAGTFNWSGGGAQLWRSSDGRSWEQVSANGLGDTTNAGISALLPFEGNLYAATSNWDPDLLWTTGAQILRSSDGSAWDRVNLPGIDPDQGEILALAEFNGSIFAGTDDYSQEDGAEIWSSPTGNDLDWTRVVAGGLYDIDSAAIITFEVHGGFLYAGVYNHVDGAEIWRTEDGTDWDRVMSGGFNDVYNVFISDIEAFNGQLYIGVYNRYRNGVFSDNPGAELWRCTLCDGTDWQEVANTKGFGDQNNLLIYALYEFQGRLFAATANYETGAEVWSSADGDRWNQVGFDGLTDSATLQPFYGDNSITLFLNRLFIGFQNKNGGAVWTYLDQKVFLPLALR